MVGSFAFQAFGNMLGVDWETRAMMTQDVDIAAGNECIPIESMVFQHQQAYYQAIRQSTAQGDSAPFIEFMLVMILDSIQAFHKSGDQADAQSTSRVSLQASPQVTPQVSPQVKALLVVMNKAAGTEMSRSELQEALALKDRKSFVQRYLTPAMEAGLIEMTLPEKPRSSLHKYRLSTRMRKQ